MNKKRGKREKECLFLIANLVISIFAIAFMIGWETRMVSAQTTVNVDGVNYLIQGDTVYKAGTNEVITDPGLLNKIGNTVTPAPAITNNIQKNAAPAVPAATNVLTNNALLTKDSVSLLGAGAKVTPVTGQFAGKDVVLGSKLASGDGYNVASIAGKPATGQIASSDLVGGKVNQLPTSSTTGTQSTSGITGILSKLFTPAKELEESCRQLDGLQLHILLLDGLQMHWE